MKKLIKNNSHKRATNLHKFYKEKKDLPYYIKKNKVYNPPAPFLPNPIKIERRKRIGSFMNNFLRYSYSFKARNICATKNIVRIQRKILNFSKIKPRRSKITNTYYIPRHRYRLISKARYYIRGKRRKEVLKHLKNLFKNSIKINKEALAYKKRVGLNQNFNHRISINEDLIIKAQLFNLFSAKIKTASQLKNRSNLIVVRSSFIQKFPKAHSEDILPKNNEKKRKFVLVIRRAMRELYFETSHKKAKLIFDLGNLPYLWSNTLDQKLFTGTNL